jgi:hypothetical protein
MLLLPQSQGVLVKVYEINAWNYYSSEGRQVDLGLELSGLAPSHSLALQTPQDPVTRCERLAVHDNAAADVSRGCAFQMVLFGDGHAAAVKAWLPHTAWHCRCHRTQSQGVKGNSASLSKKCSMRKEQ